MKSLRFKAWIGTIASLFLTAILVVGCSRPAPNLAVSPPPFEQVHGKPGFAEAEVDGIHGWLVKVSRSVYFAWPDSPNSWPGDEDPDNLGAPCLELLFLVEFPGVEQCKRYDFGAPDCRLLFGSPPEVLGYAINGGSRFEPRGHEPAPFRSLQGKPIDWKRSRLYNVTYGRCRVNVARADIHLEIGTGKDTCVLTFRDAWLGGD